MPCIFFVVVTVVRSRTDLFFSQQLLQQKHLRGAFIAGYATPPPHRFLQLVSQSSAQRNCRKAGIVGKVILHPLPTRKLANLHNIIGSC